MVTLASLAELTQSISVGGSFVAGLYQLYLGYIFEGADGFSPILLLGWLLGDVSNVIATFWTHQLVFQRIIAVASLCNTLAMSGQHVYYLRKHRQSSELPDPVSIGGGKYLAMRWNALLRPYILFTLVSAARAAEIGPSTNILGSISISHDSDYEELVDWKFLIGQCMAWVAELSYVFALIPQALENFARKSTGSVSIAMFVADAIGSISYLATILLTSQERDSMHETIEFLLEELPYIFGTATCTILDCVLLSQYFLYPQFVVEIPLVDDEDPVVYSYSREMSPLQPFRSWKSSYNAVDSR